MLGLPLNMEKGLIAPSRTAIYLGLVLDSTAITASLTPKRLSVLGRYLSCFVMRKWVTVKFGQRLLGLLAAATQVVPLGQLHMQVLQQWFVQHRVRPLENGQWFLSFGPNCWLTIEWWLMTLGHQGGVPIGQVCSRVTITTDASERSWGAVCHVQCLWGLTWRGVHVNPFELEVAFELWCTSCQSP